MKIGIDLFWGLKTADIDTELMPQRQAFKSTLKELGRVTLATIKFPDKGVEFDLDFFGGSLELTKVVNETLQRSNTTEDTQ